MLFTEHFISTLNKKNLNNYLQTYDINVTDIYNRTLLTQAVLHNKIKLIKLLLKYNININYKNNIGFSPLYLAIYFDKYNIVKLLLKYNVNITCNHYIYFTPLKYTIVYKKYNYTKLLIKKFISNNDNSWLKHIKQNEFKLYKINMYYLKN